MLRKRRVFLYTVMFSSRPKSLPLDEILACPDPGSPELALKLAQEMFLGSIIGVRYMCYAWEKEQANESRILES